MLWNMRCEKVTSSDLRKTDIKAKPQMSTPNTPPSLAAISSSGNLNNKRRQEPFSHQKEVKRSTFLVRFLKTEPPEGNLSPLEPGLSLLQRAVTSVRRRWWRQTAVSRRIYKPAVMSWRPAEQFVPPKICWNILKQSQERFFHHRSLSS